MGPVSDTPIGERGRREKIIILRKISQKCHSEDTHIASRGKLLTVRQARGISKARTLHAKITRPLGHRNGEFPFTAADRLGNHGCNVVRRFSR